MTPRLRSRRMQFVIVVVLQVVVLIGLVFLAERTIRNGTEIVTTVRPVDPIDIVRGRYVDLDYEISRVRARESSLRQGDEVVVGVVERRGVWVARGAWRSADDATTDLFVRGTVARVHGDGELEVRFSASTFYVDEGDAVRLERELADGAKALLSLDTRGNPTLCDVGDSVADDCDSPITVG